MSGVARGLAVIEALAESEEPLTHAQLARRTGLPKSTLSNVLAELGQLSYTVPVDGGHGLGPRLLSMTYRSTQKIGISIPRERIREVLTGLAHDTGETAVLAIEVGRSEATAGDVLAIDHVASRYAMRYVPHTGTPLPIGLTAAGYVLLAFTGRRSSAIPAGTLRRLTEHTRVDARDIDRELDRVRERGFAVSIDETSIGVTVVAAPWFGRDEEPTAAVSIAGPKDRIGDPARTVWPALKDALADL
jgi:DNA-binding IclR family transcriptional regulator